MSLEMSEITIVRQLPRNKSSAGHSFRTIDAAAIAALDEILPVSIGNDFEYSGAGTKRIAIYHTHGAAGGAGKRDAENFSFADMMICRSKNIVSHLGTPSRKIKKLIPPGLLNAPEKENFGLLGKMVTLR